MTTALKDQAKRLRARLAADGIEIKQSLSLELLAAVHGKANWDTLSATADPLLTQTAHSSAQPAPSIASYTQFPPTKPAPSITAIVGPSGTGKSLVRSGLCQALIKDFNLPVIGVELEPIDVIHQLSTLKRSLSTQTAPYAVVFDEAWVLTQSVAAKELYKRICAQALAGGGQVILVAQSRREIHLLINAIAGPELLVRSIEVDVELVRNTESRP